MGTSSSGDNINVLTVKANFKLDLGGIYCVYSWIASSAMAKMICGSGETITPKIRMPTR